MANKTYEGVLQEARDSWSGDTGERRAVVLDAFLKEVLNEYSVVLGIPESTLFEGFESARTYSAINYYQRCNFPSLKDVRVFKTKNEVKSFLDTKQFRCPHCKGVSSDPQVCDTGIKIEKKKCDWKSYGLFRTLGDGFKFICLETFKLNAGPVHEIFKPLVFENAD